METKVKNKLIEGSFSAKDAEEILTEIINTKINFNTIKNLSSEVCTYKPDKKATERIRELHELKQYILDFIKGANDREIYIEATLNLKVQ